MPVLKVGADPDRFATLGEILAAEFQQNRISFYYLIGFALEFYRFVFINIAKLIHYYEGWGCGGGLKGKVMDFLNSFFFPLVAPPADGSAPSVYQHCLSCSGLAWGLLKGTQ